MELRNTDDNSTEMVSGAFIHYLGVEISPANTKGVDIVEWNPVVYGIEKRTKKYRLYMRVVIDFLELTLSFQWLKF